jgi:hypothetical protein
MQWAPIYFIYSFLGGRYLEICESSELTSCMSLYIERVMQQWLHAQFLSVRACSLGASDNVLYTLS